MSIKTILKEFTDIKEHAWVIDYLRQKGFNVKELSEKDWIGQGNTSSVYEINSNKVLKISHRENIPEIDEYEKLVGKNTKHVAKIYYAKHLPEAGIVVMEKVPFSGDGDDIFSVDYIVDDIAYEIMNAHIDNPHIKDAMGMVHHIAENDQVESHALFLDGMEDDGLKIIQHVLDGLFELDRLGVHYNDIHLDNIRIDKQNNYKIVDFYR